MITKQKLIEMIDHCLYFSGESYAVVFYEKYKEMVRESQLEADDCTACERLLNELIQGALKHLEILRRLKADVEREEKVFF